MEMSMATKRQSAKAYATCGVWCVWLVACELRVLVDSADNVSRLLFVHEI
jgi:hypothetical protein